MNVHFVLVNPSTAGNIGSTARAIKTMGFLSLRLVKPCNHLSKDALKLAYGSHDILQNAQLFSSLEEALSDIDFAIATTAKNRTVWHDYHTPEQAKKLVIGKGNTVRNIALVFGREDHGLESNELALCDLRTSIPMADKYPSVNLAQSVMIYSYVFSDLLNFSDNDDIKYPGSSEQNVLKTRATELLEFIEVSGNPNLYRRMIERLMQTSEDDTHLFLSFHRFLKQKMKQFP